LIVNKHHEGFDILTSHADDDYLVIHPFLSQQKNIKYIIIIFQEGFDIIILNFNLPI
jgi:hypothetical protein